MLRSEEEPVIFHWPSAGSPTLCGREGFLASAREGITCTTCNGLLRAQEPKDVIIPDHYGGREDPYEVFKVIRAWEVNFFLGNTLKYIRRAGKKDPSKHIEDLEKAREYLTSEIEHLKAQQ